MSYDTYNVEITETLQRIITVQAQNAKEAMQIVREAYGEDILELNADNSAYSYEVRIYED